MAVRIVDAAHLEVESKALGATKENLLAARSYVQAALNGRKDIVSYEQISVTLNESAFRPWWRVKALKPGIRVAVEMYKEGSDNVVLIHAVAPRDDHTYDEFERLWRQYRSKA